ncbi:hypothetical protein Cgig2_016525 [Carnegiea gigantea]|uniref:Uncharacterized protein n=1 Tax=Carnegiea gigantea TaxID=171969 RepID=A0A9Q1JYS0_9CARY|nr:hypothetical protein Cgig2_016525 [Carnegiea gigantea]
MTPEHDTSKNRMPQFGQTSAACLNSETTHDLRSLLRDVVRHAYVNSSTDQNDIDGEIGETTEIIENIVEDVDQGKFWSQASTSVWLCLSRTPGVCVQPPVTLPLVSTSQPSASPMPHNFSSFSHTTSPNMATGQPWVPPSNDAKARMESHRASGSYATEVEIDKEVWTHFIGDDKPR